MTWITGEKILERPCWSEFALKRAYRSGLSPYRIFDDARMVSGSKCCFNCTKANPNYTPGFLDERGNCIPIKLPDMPEGLTATCQPLDLALEIDPVLVNHFFEAGAFVFHSGVFGHGITPSVARLLTGILGPNAVERLMLEGMCADFDPMGHLDMGDRLKAATFKLSDVEAYEGREGIGQDGQGQKPDKTQIHFACAEDLVFYYRGQGVHELHELARLVDEEFTRKARLTDEELGMLLPAKGKEAESPEGCRSQGKRLRSLYKKSQ